MTLLEGAVKRKGGHSQGESEVTSQRGVGLCASLALQVYGSPREVFRESTLGPS